MRLSRTDDFALIPARGGTILLVDDEERNLKLLEVALRPKNHRILMARTGEEYLALLGRDHPDR
jgi:CheY-like chemotaxis protein